MDATEARRAIEKAVEDAIRSGNMSSMEAADAAKAAAIKTVYEMTQETAAQVYGRKS